MSILLSKQNEIVKEIKKALVNNHDSESIVTTDLSIIINAMNNNLTILELFTTEMNNYKDETQKTILKLKEYAKNDYQISSQTMEQLKTKDNSVDIIAKIENPSVSKETLAKEDIIIVIDNLEIPGNIGTIIRTMDSAGINGLIYTDSICKKGNPKITQAARGADLYVKSLQMTYEETLDYLIKNNYEIYLGEPNLGKNYQEYTYHNKCAIICGNERFGINKKWYDNKANMVYIPMKGHNNSLNVSVAASILIYEVAMKKVFNAK